MKSISPQTNAAREAGQTSPLNLSEWTELEKLADAAHAAMQELSVALMVAALDKSEGDPISAKLLEESNRLNDFQFVSGYLLHPQSEWMGGDAFKIREPHFTGILPRRTALS